MPLSNAKDGLNESEVYQKAHGQMGTILSDDRDTSLAKTIQPKARFNKPELSPILQPSLKCRPLRHKTNKMPRAHRDDSGQPRLVQLRLL